MEKEERKKERKKRNRFQGSSGIERIYSNNYNWVQIIGGRTIDKVETALRSALYLL